jgi:hypothetical protein
MSLREPRNMLWEPGGMALIEMEGTLLGLLEKAMLLHATPGAALGLGRICDISSTVGKPCAGFGGGSCHPFTLIELMYGCVVS